MEAAQEALKPFIQSRDEVARIRKVLSAHLDHSLGGAVSSRVPLALIDLPEPVDIKPESRGLQREYLEALNANIKARRDYEALKVSDVNNPTANTVTSDGSAVAFLADHLAALELRKKLQRLQAVSGSLKQLNQMPAASVDFLDTDSILNGSPALPEVPKDAVSSFVLDKTLSKSSLDELVGRLQKSVLRAKLLLKKEEQLLDAVKARRASRPSQEAKVPEPTKLVALTATRDELIGWIETELALTSGAEDHAAAQQQQSRPSAQVVAENRRRVEERVLDIKNRYDEYVAMRTSLVEAVASRTAPHPAMEAPRASNVDQTRPAVTLGPPEATSTLLLTPYLEGLLAVAYEQKGLITQKSYLNATLAKQTKETCQLLDHLAEESQLLPKHPMSVQARRQVGLAGDGALSGLEKPNVSARANVWVFAAEAAKLATLETVVEKTEEGEMALSASMQHLDEIDRLLQPPADGGGLQQDKPKNHTDVWSILDGGLGLIGDESFG